MGQDEQNRIIGQVVSDLAAAKRKLACLQAKADSMALDFGLLCNWLRGHFPTGVELPEDLSVADAQGLATEIKETQGEVERLEAHRSHLGV